MNYVDKKTGKEIFYSGVYSAEYQERVLSVFAADGFDLFCRKHSRAWLLQQDGATIHQTAAPAGNQVSPWWLAGPMASTQP